NMSEWATAVKIGTTALVLELIERGLAPQLDIAQPIDATKAISRDQHYDWIIELRDGRKISAIEVQRLYLRAVQKAGLTSSAEDEWLVREWENILNDLERDVSLTRDRVDWVAKKFLLSALQESEGIAWSDPWLQAIDLEYHNIAPEYGLYYELLRQGSMRRFVDEEEIKGAIFAPPETTRAYFRGRSVAKFNHAISSIQWDEIVFANGSREERVTLPEVTDDDSRIGKLNALLRSEPDLVTFLAEARDN
ncbi:MAG: proteasome accessory factor PafA2 family protein, partial [Verrucomicrobiota bacterium]|nr:proteasome accessory factor PafA2 family protein [Verrucomicrobiota bacterium]